MANGDALKRRYRIIDEETGEELDEPCYVLRPRADGCAATAMFVYARLCGIDEYPRLLAVGRPDEKTIFWRELLDYVVIPRMDLPKFTDTFEGDVILDLSNNTLGADGSAEYGYKLLESLGVEAVGVVTRSIPEERMREAGDWIKHKRDAAQDEELRIEAETATSP